MNFKQIQDAVLADAFAEAKRADAKNWINHRYTWLCDLHQWPFMVAPATVTVSSGSMTVGGLPADFAIAVALLDQWGNPLEAVRDWQTFYDRYTGIGNTQPGPPEAYTVIAGGILVGPTSNFTGNFQLVYERAATLLNADADTPIIPAGYHIALVQGGKAEGFRLNNVGVLADSFDADFRGTVDAMEHKYLSAIRDKQRQSPAYRPC